LQQQRAQTAKAMTAPAPVIPMTAAAIAVPTATTDIRAPSSGVATSVLTSALAEPMSAATGRGQTEMRGEVATVPASTPAAYLSYPKPEYPQQAREDREEGLVVLRVLISPEGRPINIQLDKSSGFRALDAAAVSGVKRWSFTPATHNQRAIEAWIDIPIRFRLDQNAE
jgi:protein TonB